MKVKPVVYYRKPGYPTGADIQSCPGLLKCVPDRWAKNGVVLTALGMSLALCACGARGDVEPGTAVQGDAEPGTAVQGDEEPGGTAQGGLNQAGRSGSGTAGDNVSREGREQGGQGDTGGQTEDRAAGNGLVAPVFIHGAGTGAYGCIAVTAPFFLSEEEAYEIIKSEAERYGDIAFTRKSPPVLEDVKLPESRLYSGAAEKKGTVREGDLCLDGADAENRIAFEFISKDDVYEWRKENEEAAATVTLYDAKGTAEKLREELVSYGPHMSLGIFYDPCNDVDMDGALDAMAKAEEQGETFDWDGAKLENEARARAKSEELLRAQVRDFLDWLKGQGVI